MKLVTGLEKGLIHKERRRMLPLPAGYGYERENLMNRGFFIRMVVEAKDRPRF
jgi:hypothetical protein